MATVKASKRLLVDDVHHVRMVIPRQATSKRSRWQRSNVGLTTGLTKAGLLSNMLWLFFFLSNVQGDSQTSICITIEPGLLLKGDILVRMAQTHKCLMKNTAKHIMWISTRKQETENTAGEPFFPHVSGLTPKREAINRESLKSYFFHCALPEMMMVMTTIECQWKQLQRCKEDSLICSVY